MALGAALGIDFLAAMRTPETTKATRIGWLEMNVGKLALTPRGSFSSIELVPVKW
jgi:hypothetical protein